MSNTFNFDNTVCVSQDAYIDNVLGHDIPLISAHDLLEAPNLGGLNGSEECQIAVNKILVDALDHTITYVMIGKLVFRVAMSGRRMKQYGQ